jgi:hypothetical protein
MTDKPTTINFNRVASPEVWAELDDLRERNRKLTKAVESSSFAEFTALAERIATALETIAGHLAPVVVQHRAGVTFRPGEIKVRWDSMSDADVSDLTWWPAADFERVE